MNTANNKNFHCRTNSVKLMTKFFFKFKERYFWSTFFSQKLGCHAQFRKGFLHHAKIQRNLMIQFQESYKPMSWGKDGETLFHRILLATARGLTSTIAVDSHFFKKKPYGSFLWMGFNCLKATELPWGDSLIMSKYDCIIYVKSTLNQHAKHQLNSWTHDSRFKDLMH